MKKVPLRPLPTTSFHLFDAKWVEVLFNVGSVSNRTLLTSVVERKWSVYELQIAQPYSVSFILDKSRGSTPLGLAEMLMLGER